MNTTDQSFFEQYKPLRVPHQFMPGGCTQDNVIYALAQLKEASANQVSIKLNEYEPTVNAITHQKDAEEVLNYLFDKGLIKAVNCNGELCFNLSKIEVQNSGTADSLY